MKSFIKDLASVGFSKVLIIVFGLLNTIIIARLLTPAANGVISALSVYPSLFMTIGSMGIRQSTTYFVGQKMYSMDEIKKAVVSIWFFTSVLSVIICFLLIYFFSSNGSDITLVILAVAAIPFSLFNTYSSGIFLGQNNIQGYNRINWVPIFITFLSNLVLVWGLGANIKGALLAILLGNLAITIILIFKDNFFRFFSFNFNVKLIKEMLSLGIIYAISLLIISLNYKLDIILLDKLSNNYQIGIYSKGASLMEYLWQIPMLLSTIIFSRSANSKDGKNFSYKVASLLRISFVLVGIASVFLFVLAPYIIVLLFGKGFLESVTPLRLMLPGVLLMTIVKVLYVDLAGKGNLWGAIKSMSIGLVINVVLNVILIPDYGANGAAFSSAVSYSIASILFLIDYSKAVAIPIAAILKFNTEDKKIFLALYNMAKNKLKI
jgi:O-antigen/teichoic acid export membrane protein